MAGKFRPKQSLGRNLLSSYASLGRNLLSSYASLGRNLLSSYAKFKEKTHMLINIIISGLKWIQQILRYLFWACWWLFGVGALLWWFPLRWWPGGRFFPVGLVNYFMPWQLVGLLPGVAIAGLARRKWLGLILAIPTILIGLTFAPLFLPRPNVALAGNNGFKIMSYNIWRRNPNLTAVAAVIEQEQPDILLLQEVHLAAIDRLTELLEAGYLKDTVHVAFEPSMGQAVISRYPLTRLGASSAKGRVQKVRVDTAEGPLVLWNIHPKTPFYSWPYHHRQFTRLAADIPTVKGPLIIGGDFNTTDQSEVIDEATLSNTWLFGPGEDRHSLSGSANLVANPARTITFRIISTRRLSSVTSVPNP